MLSRYHGKGKQDGTTGVQPQSLLTGESGDVVIPGLWKAEKLIFASRPDKFCTGEPESIQMCVLPLSVRVWNSGSEMQWDGFTGSSSKH